MARHRGRGRHGGARPDQAGVASPTDAAPVDVEAGESAAEGASEAVPAKRPAAEGGRRAAPRQREPGKPREQLQPRPPRRPSELQPASGRPNSGRRQLTTQPRERLAAAPRTDAAALVAETAGAAEAAGAGEPCEARKGCTLAQMRRFIKSRPYVPLHELRRRFEIEGVEDEVHPIAVDKGRLFVGLPAREAGFLGELIQSGEVGYELLLDPVSPALVGVFPMRPVARQ